MDSARINQSALAFEQACLWEVEARKAGNVFPGKSLRNMNHQHFYRSAQVVAKVLRQSTTLQLGELIYLSLVESFAAVSCNTNLGIVLLTMPWHLAWVQDRPLEAILQSTTIEETEKVYQAIRAVQAGGMGQVEEQDIHKVPTIPLKEAMALASERDLIARQYDTNYQVFLDDFIPRLKQFLHHAATLEEAIIRMHVCWMALYPDTLITRKFGDAVARKIMADAQALDEKQYSAEFARDYFQFDDELRHSNPPINPGTTADFMAAGLYYLQLFDSCAFPPSFSWKEFS